MIQFDFCLIMETKERGVTKWLSAYTLSQANAEVMKALADFSHMTKGAKILNVQITFRHADFIIAGRNTK